MRPKMGVARPPIPADVTISHTFRTTTTGGLTNQTSHTFAATSLGTTAARRRIVVAVSSNRDVDGVTIAGVAATAVVTNVSGFNGALFTGLNADDATADIVVTLASAGIICDISVWALYDSNQNLPGHHDVQTDTSFSTVGSENIMSVSLDVPVNGVALAYSRAFDESSFGGATASYPAGVDEDFDNPSSGFDNRHSGASRKYTDAVNGQNVQVNILDNGGIPGGDAPFFLIAASWGG